MTRRYYPAVLERGVKNMLGAWFPDFPGAVGGGKTSEQAMERAEEALRQAVQSLVENEVTLPEATPIETIELPDECEFVAFALVGIDPPDPSERVNVYLPRSLIAAVDRRAQDLGMSRSSFFGLAVSTTLAHAGGLPSLAALLAARGAEKTVKKAKG